MEGTRLRAIGSAVQSSPAFELRAPKSRCAQLGCRVGRQAADQNNHPDRQLESDNGARRGEMVQPDNKNLSGPTCRHSQISAASFQSFPIFSHTTTYLPVTSFGVGPLVLRLKVPISRAAEGPSGLTSRVVSFGSLTCSAMLFHIAPMAALPFTIAEPGGNAVASSV